MVYTPLEVVLSWRWMSSQSVGRKNWWLSWSEAATTSKDTKNATWMQKGKKFCDHLHSYLDICALLFFADLHCVHFWFHWVENYPVTSLHNRQNIWDFPAGWVWTHPTDCLHYSSAVFIINLNLSGAEVLNTGLKLILNVTKHHTLKYLSTSIPCTVSLNILIFYFNSLWLFVPLFHRSGTLEADSMCIYWDWECRVNM